MSNGHLEQWRVNLLKLIEYSSLKYFLIAPDSVSSTLLFQVSSKKVGFLNFPIEIFKISNENFILISFEFNLKVFIGPSFR